jgi:hypothetical protein
MSNTNNWNDSDFHLPYNRQLVEKAKELRKNMTPAEKRLWYGYLRTFKFRVLRQRPKGFLVTDDGNFTKLVRNKMPVIQILDFQGFSKKLKTYE